MTENAFLPAKLVEHAQFIVGRERAAAPDVVQSFGQRLLVPAKGLHTSLEASGQHEHLHRPIKEHLVSVSRRHQVLEALDHSG